jgi:hypothetical protein
MAERFVRGLVVMSAFGFLLLALPALADHQPGHNPPGQTGFSDPQHEGPGRGVGHHTDNRGNSGHPAPGHVPELDPGLIGSAAVLLIGGTLVLHGRRRIGADV